MTHKVAVQVVTVLRAEVVGIVGICGRGTHPLTDILEDLEQRKHGVRPEDAVVKAQEIRNSIADFR